MDRRMTDSDRRAHGHRKSNDRRTGDLPRLIDRDAAIDAATQAMAVGEALAAERIRVAAEYEMSKR